MKTERRFLIASSFARLIQKEAGLSGRIVEGHFASQSDRITIVRIENERCELILLTSGAGEPSEERTEVPRSHAEALLDVAAGKIGFARAAIPLGGPYEAFLDSFVAPERFHMLTVEFDQAADAGGFEPPGWFGDDVTSDPAFERRSIAVDGRPQIVEPSITNAMLNGLLDVLDRRRGLARLSRMKGHAGESAAA